MSGIVFPGTTSYTYRATDAPPKNYHQRELRAGGDRLSEKAEAVEDFFRQADNSELDTNPEFGKVSLRGVLADGLIEDRMDSLSGYWEEGKYLSATAYDSQSKAQSHLHVADENGSRNIFNDRASHFNNRYLPTVESLTANADGTLTYATAYDAQRSV